LALAPPPPRGSHYFSEGEREGEEAIPSNRLNEASRSSTVRKRSS